MKFIFLLMSLWDLHIEFLAFLFAVNAILRFSIQSFESLLLDFSQILEQFVAMTKFRDILATLYS